ncbi:MAG: PEGA domain-containing protein [Planctomycetota bacterium]|nr:MAG: PEGA domain-containing protein [Planctomycetota bacterium]
MQKRFPRRFQLFFLSTFFLITFGGCVERKIEIQTTPIGGEVYLDDQYMGKSPLQITFYHYGTRKLEIRKRGYHRKEAWLKISPPLYEVFPLDFFSELVFPFTLHDIHKYHFVLQKKPSQPMTAGEMDSFWKKSINFLNSPLGPKERK